MLHVVIASIIVEDALLGCLALVTAEGYAEFIFEVAALLYFAFLWFFGCGRFSWAGDLGEDVGGGFGVVDQRVVLGTVDEGVGGGCFLVAVGRSVTSAF